MTKKLLKLTRLVHNSLALLNLIMNHVSYNGNELLWDLIHDVAYPHINLLYNNRHNQNFMMFHMDQLVDLYKNYEELQM